MYGPSLTLSLLAIARQRWARAEEGKLVHDIIAETRLKASKDLAAFTPMQLAYVPYAISKIYNASRSRTFAFIRSTTASRRSPHKPLHRLLAPAPHPEAAARVLRAHLSSPEGQALERAVGSSGLNPKQLCTWEARGFSLSIGLMRVLLTRITSMMARGSLNGLQAANCVLGLTHVLHDEAFSAHRMFAKAMEKDEVLAAQVMSQRHSATIALYVLQRSKCEGFLWEQHVRAAVGQMQRIAVQHGIGQGVPGEALYPEGAGHGTTGKEHERGHAAGGVAGAAKAGSHGDPEAEAADSGCPSGTSLAGPSPLQHSPPYLIAGLLHLAALRKAPRADFVREAVRQLSVPGALEDLSIQQLDDLAWAAGALALEDPELGHELAERAARLAPGLKKRELLSLCLKLSAMQCITPSLLEEATDAVLGSHPGLEVLARLPVQVTAREGPVAAWRTRVSLEHSTRQQVRSRSKMKRAQSIRRLGQDAGEPRDEAGAGVGAAGAEVGGARGQWVASRGRDVPGAPVDVAEQPTSVETMRSLITSAKIAVAQRGTNGKRSIALGRCLAACAIANAPRGSGAAEKDLVAAVVFGLAHLPPLEAAALLSNGPVAFRLGASLEALTELYEEQAEDGRRRMEAFEEEAGAAVLGGAREQEEEMALEALSEELIDRARQALSEQGQGWDSEVNEGEALTEAVVRRAKEAWAGRVCDRAMQMARERMRQARLDRSRAVAEQNKQSESAKGRGQGQTLHQGRQADDKRAGNPAAEKGGSETAAAGEDSLAGAGHPRAPDSPAPKTALRQFGLRLLGFHFSRLRLPFPPLMHALTAALVTRSETMDPRMLAAMVDSAVTMDLGSPPVVQALVRQSLQLSGALQSSVRAASALLWGSLCLGERRVEHVLPVLTAVQGLSPAGQELYTTPNRHLSRLYLALVACRSIEGLDMTPLLHRPLVRAMRLAEAHAPIREHPWIVPGKQDGSGGGSVGAAGRELLARRSVALEVARVVRGMAGGVQDQDQNYGRGTSGALPAPSGGSPPGGGLGEEWSAQQEAMEALSQVVSSDGAADLALGSIATDGVGAATDAAAHDVALAAGGGKRLRRRAGEPMRSRWLEAQDESEVLQLLHDSDPVVALFAARCAGMMRRRLGVGHGRGRQGERGASHDGVSERRKGSSTGTVGQLGTLAATAAALGASGAPPGARQLVELPVGSDTPAALLALSRALLSGARGTRKSASGIKGKGKGGGRGRGAESEPEVTVRVGADIGDGLRPLLAVEAKDSSPGGEPLRLWVDVVDSFELSPWHGRGRDRPPPSGETDGYDSTLAASLHDARINSEMFNVSGGGGGGGGVRGGQRRGGGSYLRGVDDGGADDSGREFGGMRREGLWQGPLGELPWCCDPRLRANQPHLSLLRSVGMGTLPPYVTAVLPPEEDEDGTDGTDGWKEGEVVVGADGTGVGAGAGATVSYRGGREDEDGDGEGSGGEDSTSPASSGVPLLWSEAVERALPLVSELTARGVLVEPRYLSAPMRLVHDVAVAKGWVPVFVHRDVLEREDAAVAEALLERAGGGAEALLPAELEAALDRAGGLDRAGWRVQDEPQSGRLSGDTRSDLETRTARKMRRRRRRPSAMDSSETESNLAGASESGAWGDMDAWAEAEAGGAAWGLDEASGGSELVRELGLDREEQSKGRR